jgi:hypothetical protein
MAVVAVLSLELVVPASLLFLDQAASTSVLPEDLRAVAAVLLVDKAFQVPLVLSVLVLWALFVETVVQGDALLVLGLDSVYTTVLADSCCLIVQKRAPPKRRSLPQSLTHRLKYTSNTLANAFESSSSRFTFVKFWWPII